MTIRRPIGNWSVPLDELGMCLVPDEEQEGRVLLYALFADDVAALLEPDSQNGGWKLAPVTSRERAVLSGRHPDRDLRFPDDPAVALARSRELEPLQSVDPRCINLLAEGGRGGRRSQIVNGDWDLAVLDETLADTAFYRAMKARYQDGQEWSEIPEAGEVASDDIQREDLDRLHRSMRDDGYHRQEELGGGRGDEVQVAISRGGRFILLNGRKRVALARILEMSTIPVAVARRHSDWEDFRERLIGFAGRRQGRVYQRLSHPDLSDLRASQESDRIELIVGALAGYPARDKRLMDIGAQWGQVSCAMEQLGFDVTGVEANSESAAIATQLRDAGEHRYKIWAGSVFDYPEVERQDIIVGLNIFHHFLKTEEMYNGLSSVLERFRGDVVIFSAHHGRGREMRDAYRDYRPNEFAEFVSERAGLPTIERIGESHDGRPLFKITA